MLPFADRLVRAIRDKGNPVCVGLDPRFELLPARIRQFALRNYGQSSRAVANAFVQFNRALIDALADLVPACKPQAAFYEAYGAEGMRAFDDTINYARRKGLIVLADVKRGDVDSTAEAYAIAHLGGHPGIAGSGFDADAVTVNPYLGSDSLRPFLRLCAERGRGIFVLVRTSNPGARDLQDLLVDGRPLYERVGEMVRGLGGPPGDAGFGSVGAVIGATYPDEAHRLREILPESLFLVPGYGAQGAGARDAVAGFRSDGLGGIVSSSRGITFAFRDEPHAAKHGEEGFAAAARDAAEAMAAELNAALRGR